jgi:hypothetical protein
MSLQVVSRSEMRDPELETRNSKPPREANQFCYGGCIKTATLGPFAWLSANPDLQNFTVISIACLGDKNLVGLAPPLPYLCPNDLNRLNVLNYLNGAETRWS